MRAIRRAATFVLVLAAAAQSAAPAAASSLPRLWARVNAHGAGVYKVRPHTVDLAEAAGGTLTLTWSSWTDSAAEGSGTAVASGMGSSTTLQVNVHASRVRDGKFTRLELTTTGANGQPDIEKLKLTGDGWST